MKRVYPRIKRLLDIIFSFAALIVLSPVFFALYLAIRLESKGPAFFKQKRVGRNKTHFQILKFRTMRTDTPKDVPTHLLKLPGQYITRVGAFLRKTSLDELPQIINILKGDMSFVGPRPALWNQFDLLEERDRYKVNTLTPGLTGWAQVNGRDELSIEVKARYDGEYKEKMSFLFDLRIVLLTIKKVFLWSDVMEGGPPGQ